MRAVFYVPHPDDDLYSMWIMMHLMAAGYNVVVVFLTRGETSAHNLKLTGAVPCGWSDHAYSHNPGREGFILPTIEEVGVARLKEGMSCIGAMAMIPPSLGVTPGTITIHDENLGTAYGSSGAGSSTAPTTPEGEAAAEAVIRKYIAMYPNSFHYSMSPTDKHPDHAACGKALRKLKGAPVYTNGVFTFVGGDPVLAPFLQNAMFFASKLYWGNATTPREVELAKEYNAWYPNYYPANNQGLARLSDYSIHLRKTVSRAYTSWNPTQGSLAIGGGHSTPSQMWNCILNPAVTISALWHP